MIRTSARRLLLGGALALACSPALAASVTQTGQVVSPQGQIIGPQPTTQFNQSCNGGAGGIVGQTYNGSVCAQPTSASTTPSAGSAPGVAGSAASSAVLKNASGNLVSVYVTPTAAGWLMVFNATAAPGNGATTAGKASGNLQDCIYAPANVTTSVDYSTSPEPFGAGITAVFSSTGCATLTASSAAFIHGTVQ